MWKSELDICMHALVDTYYLKESDYFKVSKSILD
jgi:hypothetical protein